MSGKNDLIKKAIKLIIAVLFTAIFTGLGAYFTITLIIKSEDTVIVPDLRNKDVVYALNLLTELGLDIKVRGSEYSVEQPENHIIYQEPAYGTKIKKGRDINVILSKGFLTVPVPNIAGFTYLQAENILNKNGLCVKNKSIVSSPKFQRDIIIAQSPLSDSIVKKGECIDLLISSGSPSRLIVMSDLINMPIDKGVIVIEKDDMRIERIEEKIGDEVFENIIIGQEPAAGYLITKDTPVFLTVSKRVDDNRVFDRKRPHLITYRLEPGILNMHIKAVLKYSGVSLYIFDDFVKSGEVIRILLPSGLDADLEVYEDEILVKSKFFEY